MCGIAKLTLCTERKKERDKNKMQMPPQETIDTCTHTYRHAATSFVSLFFLYLICLLEAQWLPRKSIVAVNMQVPGPGGKT